MNEKFGRWWAGVCLFVVVIVGDDIKKVVKCQG